MAANDPLLGQFIGARYRGVPGVLYHVRFLGASAREPLTPFAYVSRTPDGDYYEEDYGDQRNFEDIILETDFQTFPGIGPGETYPFRAAPSVQERAAWSAHCQSIVARLVPGRIRALGVAPPGAVVANQVAPAGLANMAVQPVPVQVGPPAKLDLAWDRIPGALQWVLAESAGPHNFGTRLDCPAALVKGQRLIHNFNGLGPVFLKCIASEEVDGFLNLPSQWDSRLMPMEKHALGKPERSLISVASTSREEKVLRSLQGDVRSAPWCIAFLQSEGLGFEGHHERLRQVAGVRGDAWGISEHFQIMMVAKLAFQIDQIDGVNCAFMESLLRRAQTIEFGWAERIKEKEAKGFGGGRLSLEEQTMFGGLVRQASTLMICPALIDFVRAEVEKEAKLQKALRMAREERESESKRNKGKNSNRKEGE